MLKVIQYRLGVVDRQAISMPKNSKILSVHAFQGKPCLFVLADNESEQTEERVFRMYDTNRAIEPGTILEDGYVGTFQLDGYDVVFHVFEGV